MNSVKMNFDDRRSTIQKEFEDSNDPSARGSISNFMDHGLPLKKRIVSLTKKKGEQ